MDISFSLKPTMMTAYWKSCVRKTYWMLHFTPNNESLCRRRQQMKRNTGRQCQNTSLLHPNSLQIIITLHLYSISTFTCFLAAHHEIGPLVTVGAVQGPFDVHSAFPSQTATPSEFTLSRGANACHNFFFET